MTNGEREYRTLIIEPETQVFILFGPTPIKLVENRSRAVHLRRTGVYRIVATGIIIAGGCCCGKSVSPGC